jgi:uroporphyrinogen-III decarboxylase
MNKKQRVLAAIQRREVDRIPTSYRGLKFVSESLMRYFGIAQPDIFSINYTEHSHGLTYHALGINARFSGVQTGSLRLRKDEFIAMGSFNSVFIICSYLRGMEQFLIDLLQNKKIAQRLIGEVGEFVLEFNRRELSSFGRDAEFYSSWDDVAGQRGMLFPPELFKEHFLPIYRELYENVKKYDLIIDYHCCGSVHEVLPMKLNLKPPLRIFWRYTMR